MVQCPVCGAENNDLDTVCRSCKGFIQTKVDTLDLFSTCWGLIENPDQTFRRIALSRSKNYVGLLSALLGVTLAYTYIWYWELATELPNLALLLGLGAGLGLVLGNPMTTILGLITQVVLRLGGKVLSLRNCRAILTYAGMPVVFSLVIVFPVEIAVFGSYFFDKNPSPMVINPPIYIALIGLDALAALWSVALLAVGIRAASRASWLWSLLVPVVVVGVLAWLIAGYRLV